MEQKRTNRGLTFGIINELLKKEDYIRSLAKNLKTSHTNIIRIVNRLVKENVLDYEKNGRNKVYFLKKTIEARSMVFMNENHNLINFLNKYPELRNVIEKIQKEKKIKLAILFGSYTKGLANQESDIDIYIETEDIKLKKSIEMINSKLSVKIGTFDLKSLLIKEIIKNHVILKGIEEFYEKNEFFE
ncbi:MAG: nucleotidyltransferase domain-containing protein [Candidatus Pacearchaeota archaeon]|nr:nucleotidyltransferase domain-containing protein [Candidatus Pacearchaeota archaeon]